MPQKVTDTMEWRWLAPRSGSGCHPQALWHLWDLGQSITDAKGKAAWV